MNFKLAEARLGAPGGIIVVAQIFDISAADSLRGSRDTAVAEPPSEILELYEHRCRFTCAAHRHRFHD